MAQHNELANVLLTGTHGSGAVFNGSIGPSGPPPPPPPAPITLDAPVDSGISTKTQQAYGFDRMVDGYIGNTATLQRASDSSQQAFGCDSSGRFNMATVQSWAGGSNVTVVNFLDQKGSGKLLSAVGSVPFITSSAVTRFGTTWDTSTAQLTLSATDGGVGCRVEGGTYFQLTSSALAASNGLMVHMLASALQRKKPTNDSTDPAGLNGNTTGDCWFSYGLSTTNNFSYELTGGVYLHRVRRIATGAGGTDQSLTTGGRMKQNSLFVHSSYTNANTGLYGYGRRLVNATTSAGNVTANSTFSNGTFRIGRRYSGATGEASTPGNLLFGGVIITETLTDLELYKVQAKLTTIANQHRAASLEDLQGMFDEYVDMRDINVSTGVVVGKQGKLTLNFNLATSFGGKSPDWTLQNTISYFGLQGVKSNDDTNYANTFVAADNYFADVQTGTMVVLAHRDPTGNSANYATDLGQWLADGTNAPPNISGPAQNTDFSKGLGFHHAHPNMYTKAADSLDPNMKTGTTPWGDQGGKVSQPMAKYFFNTSNGGWQAPKTSDQDVTINSVLYPSGTEITTALLQSTIGVTPPTPENANYDGSNINYQYNLDTLQLQVGTFTKAAGFNSSDNQTTRDANARTGTAWHYVIPLGTQAGGLDCSVARQVGNANNVNSNPAAKLQSGVYLQNVKGTRFLFGFAKTAWTIDQVEILNTNLYKLVS